MKNDAQNDLAERRRDTALLFLRIFTGAMLLTGVLTKSQDYIILSGEYPRILGLDGGTVVTIAGIVEVLCAVSVITGLWIRYASAVMVAVMLGAVFIFFPDKTLAQGELNFVYAALFLYFAWVGGGRYAMQRGGLKS